MQNNFVWIDEKGLLLQHSEVESWQALIQESSKAVGIFLPEELESYLVFLLMRFIKMPELAASVLALDYLEAQQQLSASKREYLHNLADKCLLYAGFYPDRASKKQVSVDYFVKLGRTAYLDLSDLTEQHMSKLYQHLSEEFISLMEILLASWEMNARRYLLTSNMAEVLRIIRQNRPSKPQH